MKRFLGFVLCLVLLCGCSGKSRSVSPVLQNINFDAAINFYNEVYECDVTLDGDSNMHLTVVKPDDISGMKLKIGQGGTTAEYMGITYTPKTENLVFCGVADTLYGIVGQLRDKTLVIQRDENCFFEGRIDGRAYTFCCAPSGLPLYVEIPDSSYRMEFMNIKLTKTDTLD